MRVLTSSAESVSSFPSKIRQIGVMLLLFPLSVVVSRRVMSPATNIHTQHSVVMAVEVLTGAAMVATFLRKVKKNLWLLALPNLSWRLCAALSLGAVIVIDNAKGVHLGGRTVVDYLLSGALCLMIGIAEEFMCRGVLYIRLLRKGFWYAAIYSSLIFGLLHGLNFLVGQSALTTVAQLLEATGMGIFLLGTMLYTRSIWTPVLIHAAFDFPPVLGGARIMRESLTFGQLGGVLIHAVLLSAVGMGLCKLSELAKRAPVESTV